MVSLDSVTLHHHTRADSLPSMLPAALSLCLVTLSLCFSPCHAHYTSELQLNFLCDPGVKAAYVRDVPWDCSSYVICVDGAAVPATCPRGKLYQGGPRDGKCQPSATVDASRCHGSIWNNISVICQHNPRAHIPDASHCGQYYDCAALYGRLDILDYLVECPYPQLFSRIMGRCENFLMVECQERPEPKAPCDYFQYLQLHECRDLPCPACKQSHPSCVGLRNGHHPVPHRTDLSMECGEERTLNIQMLSTASSIAMAAPHGGNNLARLSP